MLANDTNRVRGAVLCLSQDGACTNLFKNFSENNLKRDLSNDTADNPPLFSLVNTFNVKFFIQFSQSCTHHVLVIYRYLFLIISYATTLRRRKIFLLAIHIKSRMGKKIEKRKNEKGNERKSLTSEKEIWTKFIFLSLFSNLISQ